MVAGGSGKYETGCSITYLVKECRAGNRHIKRSNKCHVVRSASVYYVSLSADGQEECRHSA
jgi:hypothetical protein